MKRPRTLAEAETDACNAMRQELRPIMDCARTMQLGLEILASMDLNRFENVTLAGIEVKAMAERTLNQAVKALNNKEST